MNKSINDPKGVGQFDPSLPDLEENSQMEKQEPKHNRFVWQEGDLQEVKEESPIDKFAKYTKKKKDTGENADYLFDELEDPEFEKRYFETKDNGN